MYRRVHVTSMPLLFDKILMSVRSQSPCNASNILQTCSLYPAKSRSHEKHSIINGIKLLLRYLNSGLSIFTEPTRLDS